MRAVVLPHVHMCGDGARQGDGGVSDGLGLSGEGEDGAMGVGARVDVQQPHAGDVTDGCGKGRDHDRIAALGDIRDALDQREVRHASA